MYLKSLELQGFKSFVEKTVLVFDRGMSAVVGPNGSGKSNVSDAIRWVLGEQSIKTLRSGKMEDVIFKGTQERGPVGYAEVSLILDNEDRTLGIDSNEVMVTRRYYRSGESEYYINRTPVRLRDVHELFMDTGLGRDGYSIIGQGRIDEILAVKSGDRRDIFEEAAGISKYRYRKEEAERKLDATEQNLLRISDKIAELEITVGPLREQSEKAKRYLILRDELRVFEVSVWYATLTRLKSSVMKVRGDFETITKQLEDEKGELDALYENAAQLAERMRDKDVELERRRSELTETEERLHGIRSEAEVAATRRKSINENIERIENEAAERTGREQSLQDQYNERIERAGATERVIEEIGRDIASLEAEINELLTQSGELDAKADAIAALIDGSEEEAASLRLEQSSLTAAAGEMNARKSALDAELAEREPQLEELNLLFGRTTQEAVHARANIESLKNVIQGYEMRLEKRRSKLEASEAALVKLKMEKGNIENRFRILSDMEREYEGFSRAVKLVMNEAKSIGGIHGPLAGLINTEDRFSLAVETALGQSLQSIICDNESNAKTAIEFLKHRDGGRATFLPINAIRTRTFDDDPSGMAGYVGIADELVDCDKKYRDILGNLLSRTVIFSDMDSAINAARRFAHRFRIVTLDGQVLNAGGSMTGGSAGRGTGVLSRANELRRLEGEQKILDEKVAVAEAERRELLREVTAAGYECEVARTELGAAEELCRKHDAEASAAGHRLEAAELARDALATERDALLIRIGEADTGAAHVAERLETCVASAARLRPQLDELRQGSGEAVRKRGGVAERMAELRERRSAATAELTGIRESAAELLRMSEQFGSDRERSASLIDGYRAECDTLSETIMLANARGDELQADCERRRADIAALNAERMGDEAARTVADKKAQEKNASIINLERERGRFEQKISEADMEERNLLDKLWDSYELTPLTAPDVALPVDNMQQFTQKASSKRREITSLGDVNVGAIDEFTRINERYTYLTTQADDVTRSANELKSIISEITEKMRVIFAEEFEKINRSFSETFVVLFGGGRAVLRLENEDDILSSGIAIEVRLPGKATMSVGALSGGERAFTAIALYFAILRVRPTPFCVLDEVDTALDDINVLRFAQYMRTLLEHTQFISITHKRGTMEECDVLYGVTMPKPGVSKILALDIGEVERSLGMKLG